MLYALIYSDGKQGAALSWGETLDLVRRRRDPLDSLRLRGIVPVRVVRVER